MKGLPQTKQFIQTDPGYGVGFFSSPDNPERLHPEMNFKRFTKPEAVKMYAGQLISYKRWVRFPFMRVRWTNRNKTVNDKNFSSDEQKLGPFHFGIISIILKSKDGGIEMTDRSGSGLFPGFLGRL